MLQEKLPDVTGTTVPLQAREARPERESEAVPVAVTVEVVKLAPSAGEVTTKAGDVLSRFTVTLVEADAVAVSVAVPVTIWPVPSVEMVCGDVQLAMTAEPGVQVNVTVTFVLFHALGFGKGNGDAEIVGGDGTAEMIVKLPPLLYAPLSIITSTLPDVAALGTGVTIWESVQLVGLASVPLKVTKAAPV